ncbi:hypothetical protein N7453_009007 [Penicillium expansum]|nr:hypothetical protein N7453_009007 [Penicillium expansum]
MSIQKSSGEQARMISRLARGKLLLVPSTLAPIKFIDNHSGLYGALQNGPSSTFKLEAELNASDLEIWQANYSTSYAIQDIDQ